MFNIEYLIKLSEVYSCNCKKHIQCKASNCSINGGFCSHTTEWQYAKKHH